MRPSLALPCLLLLAAACDSANDQTTCLRATVSYAGAGTGAAYVRVFGSDGNLYMAHQAASPAALAANPPVVCFTSEGSGDVALTATAWIDASGAAVTSCADLLSDTCAPAPADPQGSGASVLHLGETNDITVIVADLPAAAGRG